MTREEAINKVRQMSLPKETMDILEALAPELVESEDEKIRKVLIGYFEWVKERDCKSEWNGLKVDDIRAWLEKQKPMYNLEIPAGDVAPAEEDGPSDDDDYHYDNDEKIRKSLIEFLTDIKEISESGRASWAIRENDAEMCKSFLDYLKKQKKQKLNPDKEELIRPCIGSILTDATDERFKDYDLTLKDCLTWLNEQKEQKPVECIEFDNEFENQVSHLLASVLNGEYEYCNGFVKHAAQSLLGYAKNEIKSGELDKIERLMKALQATNAQIGELVEENYKLKEQKSTQSDAEKEYVRILKSVISDFVRDRMPKNTLLYQDIFDWLDGRHVEQEEQKPTEIDEYEIIKKHITDDVLSSEVNKRLNECGWYVTDEKPAKWSKEDEENISTLIEVVHERMGLSEKRKQYYEKWLKSLRHKPHTVSTKDAAKFGNLEYERGVKDGIQSEKSHQWKPSEEQIGALNYAYCELFKREDVGHNILGPLQELLDNLKKRI